MTDSTTAGFGKFVPGFDFLQNLAKGTADTLPQMPNMSSWVAPTLNTEDIDKRIAELKAVHFWLDQNTKALAATIQALEVQKLTLTALKNMNLSMGEIASAFKVKVPEPATPAEPAPAPEDQGASPAAPEAAADSEAAAAPPVSGLLDTMHMWTALTQQFQTIATDALREAGKAAMASGSDSDAPATDDAATPKATRKTAATKKAAAGKAPAKKAAGKTAAKAPPTRSSARSRGA